MRKFNAMNKHYFDLDPGGKRVGSHTRRQRPARPGHHQEDGFLCRHCHAFVSSAAFLSGVVNRNHCPYCLWSRHLDMFRAGDRLSACKSLMQPIGLTVKATRKKYGAGRGELMLIHLCVDCAGLSINRIAADDDAQLLFDVYQFSLGLDPTLALRLADGNVELLQAAESNLVRARLFGRGEASLFPRMCPLNGCENMIPGAV
jgi:hypothetical protein